MRSIVHFLSFSFIVSFLFFNYSCSSSVSCGGNKDAFVDNFYAFVDDIRKEQKNKEISESQWEDYDAQFNKLTEECYQKFEGDLTTSDQLGIASSVGFYFYSKHGLAAIVKLAQTDAAIKKILMEIDYSVLLSVAKEILNNPDEIHKIMGDLEKRYGS